MVQSLVNVGPAYNSATGTNTFYNGISAELETGVVGVKPDFSWFTNFSSAAVVGTDINLRFSASDLERKISNFRVKIDNAQFIPSILYSGLTDVQNNTLSLEFDTIERDYLVNEFGVGGANTSSWFGIYNNYALAVGAVSSNNNSYFNYFGYLREPLYYDLSYVRGLCSIVIINGIVKRAYRVEEENTSAVLAPVSQFNIAADQINYLPNYLTTHTCTDYHLGNLGSLHNCIKIPATVPIGQFIRLRKDKVGFEYYITISNGIGMRVWLYQ